MTQDQANEAGYTVNYFASFGAYQLDVFVKPEADLDSRILAFDCDEGELIWINGYNVDWDKISA